MGFRVKKKTLSFFLLGLLTLLLGSVSVALYVIDWNQYRDTLASLASDRLGIQVELAGDLSLGLLPRPTVSARLVRLTPGQTEFNDAIATAEQIDMHLGLGALLGGSLELQSLAFDGLSASLVETAEGWSIRGWPVSDDPSSAETLLSLDRFRINSGTITVQPLSEQPLLLEGLDVSLEGRLPSGPLDWSGSAIVAGKGVSVSGRIAPMRTETATSVKATVSVAGSMLDFSGKMADTGALQGRFQANGTDLNALLAFAAAAMSDFQPPAVPALAYALDLQIDRDSNGVSRLISRQASLGGTRGTLDLTLAEVSEKLHMTGTASMGAVPLDEWLQAIRPAAAETPTSAQMPSRQMLTGSLDVSVEAVELRLDQVQQVEMGIGLSDDGVFLNQFSALLPGASRLSYVRDTETGGTLQFQSGGLQDILSWAGIEVSEAVPAGRLTTADLKGRITTTDNGWSLTDTKGKVDTSSITADISGTLSPFGVSAVAVSADTLNLDAYWPDAQVPKGDSAPQNLPGFTFDFYIGTLHWLDQNFTQIALAGTFQPSGLSLTQFDASHMDGRISGAADVQIDESSAVTDASLSLSYSNWRFPVLDTLAPDAASILSLYTGNVPAAGEIEANGPIGALQSRATLSTGIASLDFAGSLDLSETYTGRLQGSVSHAAFDSVLTRARVWPAQNAQPSPLTSNVSLEGSADQFTYTATGEFAGSPFSLLGDSNEALLTANVSMSASPGQRSGFDTIAATYGVPVTIETPRRARFSLAYAENSWSVTDIDIRNGNSVLAGTLQSENNRLSGRISVQDFDLSSIEIPEGGTREAQSIPRGDVDVALTNIRFFGQTLAAPGARISLGPDQMTFVAGEGATLNGSPLSADIGLMDNSGLLTAKLDAAGIDIAAFASTLGVSRTFSGSVSAQLDVTANTGAEQGFLSTMTGQGRFEGGAGSLYFMAVPELVKAMQSGDSASAFLNTIGSVLRSGTTDFATIRGSFQIDNGVALVDELAANGRWGSLSLDGQVNIPNDYINMSGELALTQPQDAPTIPVTYEGALSAPSARWTSRALERFAIAGIERRLRARLFGELEQAQAGTGDAAPSNPGGVVSQLAIGLLSKLKTRQEERKKQPPEDPDS